jgi:hypothetical protein
VLKKAGVIAAATVAALLSVSPLAFADDHHDGGLVDVSDLGVQVPVQLCGNDIASGTLGVLSSGQDNDSSDDTACDADNSISHDD